MTILTQDSVLSTFTSILDALTAALAGIAAISLGVAGLGIMNVMLVSFTERTREIGLLKAVGVTHRQVVAVFLVEATVLAAIGGLLGLAAGIGAGRALQQVYTEFPFQRPVWAVPRRSACRVRWACSSASCRRATRPGSIRSPP